MKERLDARPVALAVLVSEDPWVWGTVQRDLGDVAFVAHAPNKDIATHIMGEVHADLVIGDVGTLGQEGMEWFQALARTAPDSGRLLISESADQAQALTSLTRDGVRHIPRLGQGDELRQAVIRMLKRPAQESDGERRRAQRVQVLSRAMYSANRASAFFPGTSVNISESGARIRGHADVRAGQRLEFMLVPPVGPGVGGVAEVVWTHRDGDATEFGVRFVSLRDTDCRARLEEWVERGQASSEG